MQHPALAIDYGEARIGIAASDPCGILAHPVESIDRAKTEPIARIGELVRQRGIRTLVVGLPLRLDGSEGSACAKVRRFAAALHAALPELPLEFQDEFLSTATAQEKLHAAGKKSRQFRPIIDQAAAVEILNRRMELDTPAFPPEFPTEF
ncbi:MAG: Holliday junction resolvase RuvX [Akkermansia sp.]